MNVILYKYSCPRWYGNLSGLKNISIDKELNDETLTDSLTKIENINTGSKTCKIDLIQKYELIINNVLNYQGINTIPVNNIKDFNLDKTSK
tara:strand:- start:276 stop:548 length:273 start_codon:yes stop_codon:yes gene_type:complete